MNSALTVTFTLTAANTGGTRGVYWHKKQHKWYARLKFQDKKQFMEPSYPQLITLPVKVKSNRVKRNGKTEKTVGMGI